jgi:hypothetical protein
MHYFIKENFYGDLNNDNQLRLTGPGNHLLCGLQFPQDLEVSIEQVELEYGQFMVTLCVPVQSLRIAIPLVCDIRTLRSHTEQKIPRPSFEDLLKQNIDAVMPRFYQLSRKPTVSALRFWNEYSDQGMLYHYGCTILIAAEDVVHRRGKWLKLSTSKPSLSMVVVATTNITIDDPLNGSLFQSQTLSTQQSLDPWMTTLYETLGLEIDHLIRTKKTSSFEYGTIFPRDWIEAADLGEGDFTPETLAYMYNQSMRYISEKGEGWHEDIIGEYKTKLGESDTLIDRKMIDIEPHYILGFERLPADFLAQDEIRQKMKLVAHFIIQNASQQKYISFKRLPDDDGYYLVGNWRDSAEAFPRQKSPLSPFDVNCVFYPRSLELLRKHAGYFDLEKDAKKIEKLIERWQQHKLRFRLYHDDDLIGYSLALHGKKNIPLPIAHLDEAYDLFYGQPSMEEVDSFARKLIDPDFFYTPVGPLLVDADDDYFSTQQYHGKVIWPKQSAFAVAGLARQLKWGLQQGWPAPVIASIKKSIRITCEASFRGWRDLKSVPELYYYDHETRMAKFYTDQPEFEGQMSLIQLWSAVGGRRIIREYAEVIGKSS